jgi:hypothetical protein
LLDREVAIDGKSHYLSDCDVGGKLEAMSTNPSSPEREISLRQLYPNLSDSQLEEADENLRQYVALTLRVFERLERDPDAWRRFEALTASQREFRMNHKRPANDSSQS